MIESISLRTGISIFVRNRHAFLVLIIILSALKLYLSAVVPASFDLKNIIDLVVVRHPPIGPWIALYPPLYNQSIANLNQLDVWSLASPPNMNLSLRMISLLFRLPVLILDLATAIVLYYVGKRMASPIEGRLACLAWFANPYSLFSIELLGVPDVLAIFLVVVAFGLLISRRPLSAAVILGVGIWSKLFPLFLLPPIFLYLVSQGSSRRVLVAVLGLSLLGFVGYLGWILPYGLTYLAVSTPVTQVIPFIAGTPYSVNGSAFAIISFYCLLVLFAKRGALIATLVSTFMVYYLVSNPSPQYLIWAMPLIALDVIFVNRSRILIAGAFYSLAFTQWFFVSSAFLTPSGYSLLMLPLGLGTYYAGTLPSYSLAIIRFLDSPLVELIRPLISSGFYASILVYAIDAGRSWFAHPLPNHQ